jgi:Domain of unknown function (DUF4167)
MRNGQNKRMRGRNNHRKSHNPMVRVYESNGPDVKIRGNPSHIAEKYIQLARDAQASGDPIAAENYYQHAEHYYRVIAAAQEQYRQNNPHFSRPEGEFSGPREESFGEAEDSGPSSMDPFGEQRYGTREPQPYVPREVPPYQQSQPPEHQSFRPPQAGMEGQDDADHLPSFITGNPQPFQSSPTQNGHDGHRDRFPLHRRRRRHRGPRHDMQGGGGMGGGGGMDTPSREDD